MTFTNVYIHEYFNQKYTDWDIIRYLDEFTEKSYQMKIGLYLKSLENIAEFDQGILKKKAQLLYDKYKKARSNQRIVTICNGPFNANKHQFLQVDNELPHTPEHQMYPIILSSESDEKIQPLKKKKRGGILPDGVKIKNVTPLNLLPSDNDNSIEEHNDDSDDEEDVPLPEETLNFVLNNKKSWILPSRQNVGDIVTKKMTANAKAIKRKKKLSAVKKAILHYGASQIIDLSTHMKEWFSLEDRKFMMSNYKSLLQVPSLTNEKSTFITTVENMVNEKRINEASDFCIQKYMSSNENSYLRKISKIYFDFIYRSEDGDMLDSKHMEIDIAGMSGQMLVEDLIESFYVVFLGLPFELPMMIQHIEKLKSSVTIIKFVMDMYEQISRIMKIKESTNNAFDSIFGNNDLDISKPAHCKSKLIHELWWTLKSNKTKVAISK
ncbi:hypothetical protein C1645_823714 [Glomus cerebriforme]|uniref:Uncharacterized protein n=1 Tax=Glomus cerebriforme TaxID=658196 RepID=A0A397T4U2_9GLOM|nr:hypothetical protein C1645_823714 [Glomus cerebriforme]